MEKSDKIYVAGHRGMVGSAILRKLKADGYTNIVTRTHAKLDLIRQLLPVFRFMLINLSALTELFAISI